MIKTILTAIVTYLATSIDEIPILFMLYTNTSNKGKGKTITFSYFLGTFLLIALGLLGAIGLVQIPAKWLIGFGGLLPLGMGIKMLFDSDDDEEKALAAASKRKTLWVRVLVITLALGADDLGVYIPLFTTITGVQILQMIFVFAIGTAMLCLISYRLTHIERIISFIEKKERYIVSIIFVVIGIYVMYDCGTFSGIMKLMK